MSNRLKRKTRNGVVKSNKMQKTVVVIDERKVRHPVFGKVVNKKNSYKAHDENNACQIGDLVEIMETKPISKDKRWRVVKILERAGKKFIEGENQ